jgi:predicted neutral ceramidase superfamily lipid hydrolase
MKWLLGREETNHWLEGRSRRERDKILKEVKEKTQSMLDNMTRTRVIYVRRGSTGNNQTKKQED